MCHFISGLIDNQTALDDLNKIGQDNSITFDKCDNDFVRGQLRPTEEYLIKRTKTCDCGTQLGLVTRTNSPDTERIEKREVDKLEKKGWSETKIKRWLADREKTIEKDKIKYDRIVNGVHMDIENWIDYLNKIFTGTSIRHFGLFLHWYKGGLEDERIKIKNRIKIRLSDLTPDSLLKMDEDVIYEVWR
jgi:hypothetical protein